MKPRHLRVVASGGRRTDLAALARRRWRRAAAVAAVGLVLAGLGGRSPADRGPALRKPVRGFADRLAHLSSLIAHGFDSSMPPYGPLYEEPKP